MRLTAKFRKKGAELNHDNFITEKNLVVNVLILILIRLLDDMRMLQAAKYFNFCC
jgi:hypothetical protein